jgi:carbamoyl-phosphate synthase large subunit
MGADDDFGRAFAKALTASGMSLPSSGGVFASVRDSDKNAFLPVAQGLVKEGFTLFATSGTRAFLESKGVVCRGVFKVGEGKPDAVDLLTQGDLQMVINTPLGKKSQYDEAAIRTAAIALQIPCLTTVEAARAVLVGMRSLKAGSLTYKPVIDWQ